MTHLVERHGRDELALLRDGGKLLGALIDHDDRLPEAFAAPHSAHHQEYLLHCDPLARFAVLSFVLAPRQRTPVQDHTVWCLLGVLRGTEQFDEYRFEGAGAPMRKTGEHLCEAGAIEVASPTIGDIHVITNPQAQHASVSIHVFGANIGARMRSSRATPTTSYPISGIARSNPVPERRHAASATKPLL